jgi:uncharacterized membrane protein
LKKHRKGSLPELLLLSLEIKRTGEMHLGKKTKEQRLTLFLTRAAIMAALVAVATFLVQIPNPATKGYFNVGDIMIFVSALTFGPAVGGFAGSVGSAISDIAGGYGYFAPFTFVIKGVEGSLVGLISNKSSVLRDGIAVIVAGSEMVAGYFFTEVFLYGMPFALTEVPGNISQIVVGGLVGIPLAVLLRKRLPEAWLK